MIPVLPEKLREVVKLTDKGDRVEATHDYIEDLKAFGEVKDALAEAGFKPLGYYAGAMHYEIAKNKLETPKEVQTEAPIIGSAEMPSLEKSLSKSIDIGKELTKPYAKMQQDINEKLTTPLDKALGSLEPKKRLKVKQLIAKLKDTIGRPTDRGHESTCEFAIKQYESIGYSVSRGFACDLILEKANEQPCFVEIKTQAGAGPVEKAVGQLLREIWLKGVANDSPMLIAIFLQPVREDLKRFANFYGIYLVDPDREIADTKLEVTPEL